MPEGTLARVNGTTIAVADFNARFAAAGQAALSPLPADRAPRLAVERAYLDSLIDQVLLYQEAARRGLKVDEAAAAAELQAMRQGWPRDSFDRELSRRPESGNWLAEELRTAALAKQLLAQVVEPAVALTENELQAYYQSHADQFRHAEQVHLRQIVCRDGIQATIALTQVLTGGDFAAAAREYSIAPEAGRGGDLGFISRGELPPEVEEAAFRLPVGEVSSMVETPFGVHILQVLEQLPASALTFAQARPTIERTLRRQRADARWRDWLGELRRGAKIDIDLHRLPG